jgi:hypothetical protein
MDPSTSAIDHPRSHEPAPEPDVVKPGAVSERDHARDVDPVPPHTNVGRHPQTWERGRRLRPGLEGLRRRAPTHRPVRPHGVVVVAEPIELALQLRDRVSPFLAERFRPAPLSKDAVATPVDAAGDHPGQWVLRRVGSNGYVSVDNQAFSVGNAFKAELVDLFVDGMLIQVWSKNHLIKTTARLRTGPVRKVRVDGLVVVKDQPKPRGQSISRNLTGGTRSGQELIETPPIEGPTWWHDDGSLDLPRLADVPVGEVSSTR